MICKTEGIVLHTIKHSDSGAISHILTREYGRIAFFVRHSKRSRNRGTSSYFQPLHQVEIEFYNKENREIQNIKEVSPARILKKIPFDPYRNGIVLFIAEVLYRSIPEREPNNPLFGFVSGFINLLDSSPHNISNYHLSFLVGYSKFLGIIPTTGEFTLPALFDMQTGLFTKSIPMHGYYFDQPNTELLVRLLNSSTEECHTISLSGETRSRFLNNLLVFFSLHHPGIQNLKSLEVLTRMF